MPEVKMQIPAAHADWFRREIKETLCADAEQGLPNSADLNRQAAVECQERATRYIELLDELGWSDDGLAQEVSIEIECALSLVRDGVEALGEDMKVASGQYKNCSYDAAEIEAVSSRASWLTRTLETLETEEVSV